MRARKIPMEAGSFRQVSSEGLCNADTCLSLSPQPSTRMNVPDDLKYTASHEWVRLEGANARVGITDHAQAELTDIVFVELPKVGAQTQAGKPVAVVESVKAASDIYSPVSGTVTAVNEALTANPSLLNTDPHGEGWIYQLQLSNPGEVATLKTPGAYRAQLSAD